MLRSSAFAAIVLVVAASSAHAASTLVSGALASGASDSVTCHVVNVGKKPLKQVTVALVPLTQPVNATDASCETVEVNQGCPITLGLGEGDYYCKVTIGTGAKKGIRATFCNSTTGACSEVR
jgi:hypothetical protein